MRNVLSYELAMPLYYITLEPACQIFKETSLSDHSGAILAVTFPPPQTFTAETKVPSQWVASVTPRVSLLVSAHPTVTVRGLAQP